MTRTCVNCAYYQPEVGGSGYSGYGKCLNSRNSGRTSVSVCGTDLACRAGMMVDKTVRPLNKEPVFLDEKIDTIYQFYKEERARIEGATEESGVYYIFRMLFDALSFNTRARSVTRTVYSELDREEIRRQDRLIEISNNHIISAIYKLIQDERGKC